MANTSCKHNTVNFNNKYFCWCKMIWVYIKIRNQIMTGQIDSKQSFTMST